MLPKTDPIVGPVRGGGFHILLLSVSKVGDVRSVLASATPAKGLVG